MGNHRTTILERFCNILGRAGFKTQHQRRKTEDERQSLCACAETRCMGGAFVRLCGGEPTAEQPYPKDSAIYWDGPVSKHSIKDMKPKKNGEVCVLVQKRDAWVERLYDCVEETTARYSKEWTKQA